ncbi:hypothetical protein [Pontiella sulfatireligans]|uniref:Uncharacterized protein n=1 Tax=Pontiella sulfatireligans TaxID=2750658 RepID=A0A6C2UL47_9BACT|nr:hypothetical protein [Pontiella sulfatireligans]VGO20689.1 hypothetical protein SCARR_02755 [Pontiella sulfatireligans]
MFIEVYAIPISDYNKDTGDAVRPENRRLVEMTGARIRTSVKFDDRAEIVLSNNEILLAAGSYDDLVGRLLKVQAGQIARA